MRPAIKFLHRYTGVHLHPHGYVVSAPLTGSEVWDFGTLTRDSGPSASDRADAVYSPGRVKPGTNHHREDEFIPAVGVLERVEIMNGDVDLLARFYISDRLRENIRALLGEQRGDVSLALGFLVHFFRF